LADTYDEAILALDEPSSDLHLLARTDLVRSHLLIVLNYDENNVSNNGAGAL